MSDEQTRLLAMVETTDAMVWAREFVAVHHGRVVGIGADVDLMLTWFANAIETGRSAGLVAGQGKAVPGDSK